MTLTSPLLRDISPSNIIHSEGRGILLDYHVARKLEENNSPLHNTGKLAYMAMSLHKEDGQHTFETDMESLFYSLLDIMSSGRALPWRHLCEQKLIFSVKYATLHHEGQWQSALKHCQDSFKSLIPLLERVREVVCQNDATFAKYLTAFGA